MTVRAKMRLESMTKYAGGGSRLHFSTQYDPSIPEDQRFTKFTPSGSIEMHVDESVVHRFKLGAAYYVDFEQAPGA